MADYVAIDCDVLENLCVFFLKFCLNLGWRVVSYYVALILG